MRRPAELLVESTGYCKGGEGDHDGIKRFDIGVPVTEVSCKASLYLGTARSWLTTLYYCIQNFWGSNQVEPSAAKAG